MIWAIELSGYCDLRRVLSTISSGLHCVVRSLSFLFDVYLLILCEAIWAIKEACDYSV